jgi:acetyl-CoA carboxylase carboxyltransferase component
VRPLVNMLLDEPGVELQPKWAPNIVTTIGRFGRRTVGIVANNPLRLAAASTRDRPKRRHVSSECAMRLAYR